MQNKYIVNINWEQKNLKKTKIIKIKKYIKRKNTLFASIKYFSFSMASWRNTPEVALSAAITA